MPQLDNTNNSNHSTILDVIEPIQRALQIFEEDRQNSFAQWPFSENDNCSIAEMAKAGFYFSGDYKVDDDSATCFVCGKVLDGWERTDEPWIEHQKHAAGCQFVKMRREEDDLTVEEFIDLFNLISKQYLTSQFRKKETKLQKQIEKVRELIKNQQF